MSDVSPEGGTVANQVFYQKIGSGGFVCHPNPLLHVRTNEVVSYISGHFLLFSPSFYFSDQSQLSFL